MIWLFAATLLALAALSPAFRRFGLAFVGVAILVIIALILINDRAKKVAPPLVEARPAPVPRQPMMDHDDYVLSTQDQRDPDAARRIALTEVRFGEVIAVPDMPLIGTDGAAAGATFRAVQARLYNDSKRFTLTNYSYDLTVQDCVLDRCTTVYEHRHRGVPLLIPPNQARDVTITLLPDSAVQGDRQGTDRCGLHRNPRLSNPRGPAAAGHIARRRQRHHVVKNRHERRATNAVLDGCRESVKSHTDGCYSIDAR